MANAPDTNLQKAAKLERKLAALNARRETALANAEQRTRIAFEKKRAKLLESFPIEVVRLVDT